MTGRKFKWKNIRQADFYQIQKQMIGQHLDRDEIHDLFVKIGFNKSWYLVPTLEEFKIIKKNDDNTYSVSSEGGITEALLQQCGQTVSKKDSSKKKNIGKWSEEQALKTLLGIRNEDGSPNYQIRRQVPARWEDVTL